jgi:hypothetical protein
MAVSENLEWVLVGAGAIAMGLLGLRFRRYIARGYFDLFPEWMRGRWSPEVWQDFVRLIFAGFIAFGGLVMLIGLVH